MNNLNNSQLAHLLIYLLIGCFILLFALIISYMIIKIKNRKETDKEVKDNDTIDTKTNTTSDGKKSIFNFMDFDKIEDNMIVQKDGVRYLMVVECQGINYDLMSGVEKTGVEEGFIQFLNTLRYPIQIYMQTRSINLESSINTYKERITSIEQNLFTEQARYEEMKESGDYSDKELEKVFYEITKLKNLYEYGKDIVYNTENMSLNKNILSKSYYIIVSYHSSELGSNEFDKEEIKNVAFSELYTRAQSIIRTLSVCSVNGKILNSNELVELLYMAYNREGAEVYGLDKALKSGYDELYSTAPDVIDKKMRELDKEIEEKAIEKVNTIVSEVQNEKQQKIRDKQFNTDYYVDLMVKSILEQNSQYIGEDVAQEAINRINKNKETTKEEGGEKNVQKAKKPGRPKKITNAK